MMTYFNSRFISKFTKNLARTAPTKFKDKPDHNNMPITNAMIAHAHALVLGMEQQKNMNLKLFTI